MLKGKKIVLGVTAGIAAYKAAILVRLLVKAGAQVRVVFTAETKNFVTPLTFSVLSKNPVLTDFHDSTTGEWNNHVALAEWADLLVIAPATANTIASMANGACNNLLLAVYLSAKCPVYLAPAMDLDMYKHAATKRNLATLRAFGNNIINAAYGELASGLVGEGRMAEPEAIIQIIENHFIASQPLADKVALVTAGPTHEAIDPVRFIGNNSSGKMGFAIAEELANKGAKVHLVSGPTALSAQHSNIQLIQVETADEMFSACKKVFENVDIAVFAAAVADFKPKKKKSLKIKKDQHFSQLELEETIDILGTLSKSKKANQLLVGFALETDNEDENARKKLKNKNLDFVVLNSLGDKGAGFKSDTNKITIIDKDNKMKVFELKSKAAVAADIVHHIIEKLK